MVYSNSLTDQSIDPTTIPPYILDTLEDLKESIRYLQQRIYLIERKVANQRLSNVMEINSDKQINDDGTLRKRP